MASKGECLTQVKKAFPEISEKVAQSLADDIDVIRSKSRTNLEYKRRVNEYFKSQTQEARVRIENNIRSAQIVEAEIDRISSTFDRNPKEGLTSILSPSSFKFKGSRKSIHTEHIALSNKAKNIVKNSLSREDLALARSGKLDKEIYIARHQMANKQNVTVSDPARRIAEAYTKGYNFMHERMTLAGSSRNYLDGYMKREYDSAKLTDFEEFKQDILENLDLERTFRYQADDMEFIEERLKDMYESIKTEEFQIGPVTDINSKYVELKTVGHLDKKTSRHRTLHFKDGESEFNVMTKYGKGNSLSNFVKAMENDARTAATINHLGSNPTQSWEAIKKGVAQNLTPEQVQKLKTEEGFLDDLFKNTTTGFRVGKSWKAKTGSAARSLGSMSALGGVITTALPMDFGSTFINLTAATGKNPFKAISDIMRTSVKNLSKKNRNKVHKRLQTYTDNYLGSHWDRFSSEERELGALSKAQDFFFKANLLELETDVMKSTAHRLFAAEIGDNASLGFDQLNPKFKNTLESYDISPEDWDVIRQATEVVDGESLVSLDVLDKMDIGDARKNDLNLKVSSYLTNEAEFLSVPLADVKDVTMFNRRFDPESTTGQVVKMISQFMPIAFKGGRVAMQSALGLNKSAHQSAIEAMKDTRFITSLAKTIMTMTVFGAISKMSRDAFNNRQPNFEDPRFYIDSMIRGGAMGMYGDFILAEHDKFNRSLQADILGPTFGILADFKGVGEAVIKRKDNASARAFRTVWNSTPGTDLIYLKGLLDYYIYDEFMESMSPGYKRNSKRALRRDGVEPIIE